MMGSAPVKTTPSSSLYKASSLLRICLNVFLAVQILQRPLKAELPSPESLDWGPSSLSFAGSSAAMISDHDAFLTNPALLFYYQGKNAGGGSWRTLPADNHLWNV